MTTFQDGPAKGQKLTLVRVPIFLRVTEENGTFDALNIPEDKARAREKLYFYVMARHCGSTIVCAGRGGSGRFPIVEYHYADLQPPDETMRSNDKWAHWCDAMAKRYRTHIENLKI